MLLHASPEALGVGGAGHWVIGIDEKLLHGSSGPCDTFASPCLTSREEFDVMAVRLWHVHRRNEGGFSMCIAWMCSTCPIFGTSAHVYLDASTGC